MKINRPEDIALILPPRRLRERRYSLGILYVSAYLRQHGYDNVILENKFLGKQFYQRQTNEQIEKGIIDKLVEIKPRVIGFTSSTIEINDVIEMNKKIRQQIDAVSIIGGPHVTAAPKEVLEKGFDIAVIGEGEETVFELIKELEKDNPNLSLVNGIVWKNEKNQIITNPSRELIDISNLVMPAYDKFYMDRYLVVSDETLRGVPIKAAIVMASRGCPYPCTFCACNKVFGRRVRYRNLENIRVEIKTLKHQYGAEGIWFADDTMTISKEHVQKICQLMKEEGMLWGAQARVDLADEETIKLMKESGCIQLEFGVESGNQRVLDEIIKKGVTIEQAEKTFALCHKYNIRTHAAFMIGLPTETQEEVIQTFQFVKKIKPNWYAFSIFAPLPGTYLYDHYYAPGEIDLVDYKKISFHKTIDKFNRSKVKNLDKLFSQWRRELFEGVKWRNLSHPFFFIKLFFIMPNKLERADFLFFKFCRLIKYLLNKLGFNFSLHGR